MMHHYMAILEHIRQVVNIMNMFHNFNLSKKLNRMKTRLYIELYYDAVIMSTVPLQFFCKSIAEINHN